MSNTRLRLTLLSAALILCLGRATAQTTDGNVKYTVQTTTSSGGYDPKNVTAVWVVDSNGKFVKTLCRHAATRINYLYKWIADRGSYTAVDGVTSSTINSHQTHTVLWDCRGTNGQIVADGKYTLRAEYTSANAQGPYCGTLCSFYKGTVSAVSNYANFANGGGTFQGMTLTYKPYAEIAVTNLTPSAGAINSTVPVVVTITNQSLNATAFSIAVSNVTAGTLLGAQSVSALPGKAVTNLTLSWNTGSVTAGTYQVRAVASKLATETNTVNNVLTRAITLSGPAASDIAVLSLSPDVAPAGATVAVAVDITNKLGSAVGAFTVALSNVTAGASLISTQPVASLAAHARTRVTFAWNTVGLSAGGYLLLACAGPLTNESVTADNALAVPFVLREPFHDLAITGISVPDRVPQNVTTNVVVAVTNRGDFAETFTNTLSDITGAPAVIGTRVIASLAANAGTNVTFAWDTATNASFMVGFHTIEARVSPVANELTLTNNAGSRTVVVASSLTTNALIATGATWKYLDQGLDIARAPWQTADYYDGFWASGPAPLGFNLPKLGTTISYGGDPNNRRTTTYFRRAFFMDAAPLFATGRVMRAHGAVIYLNGAEIARQNMPEGDVGYGTFAASAMPRATADSYFDFAIPTSALRPGRNLLAAELHLADASSSTAGFDLELTTVTPTVPANRSIAPSALTSSGGVQAGDTARVTVTLSNTGNTTADCLVQIRDAETGAVLASQVAGPLVPGESSTVEIPFSTFGAATGARTLQAVTIVNGVESLATLATAGLTITPADFTPHTVAAAGSLGGRCSAVAVNGSTVYLGCGSTLEIWDAAVAAAPVRKGAVRLPGLIEDLAYGSNWVYAATGSAGVQFVNVSMATQPVHRATFDSSDRARQLTLARSLLYVADGLGGVRVLNVANPAAPALAGAYQTAGPAQAVLAASTNLYVLDGYYGLQILDAANPAALAPRGACGRVTAGLAAAVIGDSVLVADADARLHRINAATSSVPFVATNALLSAAGRSLAASASGAALYVAAGAAGVLALDAKTLALGSTTPLSGEACDVALSGTTLYVAAGFAGCRSLSLASPLAPKALATFATGARPVDAVAVGSKLFVAADEGGFQIHSLQNPALPALLAAVTSVSNSRCVQVSHPLAFVGDGLYGLKIFNIANAAKPALVGSYAASGLSHVRGLALAGSRAVLTDGRVLQSVSVANPAAPALLATATNAPGSFIFDLAAVGDYIYAACGGEGLRIYGAGDLSFGGAYATPGPATGVDSVSNVLQVACGPAGWLTLSVADNPLSPAPLHAEAGAAFSAAAAGPMAYLTDGARFGAAYAAADPAAPALATSVTTLTRALRAGAAGGYMLASEDTAGLSILLASPSDLNVSGLPDEWERQIVSASLATNGAIRSVLDVSPFALGPNGFTYLQCYALGLSPTDPKSVPNRPPLFTVVAPATNPAAITEGASLTFSVTAQDDTGETAARRGISNLCWFVDGVQKQETKPAAPATVTSAFIFKTDNATVSGAASRDFEISARALDRAGSSTQFVWTARVVNAPLAQTITFKPLPLMTLESTNYNPGATATSLLPVLYASANEAVAKIVGGVITIAGAGTSVITATQPGSFDFKAASPVVQTLTVRATLRTQVVEGTGTVTGAGAYVPGASVALLARPAANYSFLRWEDGLQTPARTFSMPATNALVSAYFGITTNVTQPVITDPGTPRGMVGVPFSMPLDVSSATLPTITVAGLPAGLAYNAAARRIAGVPTAAASNKLITVSALNVSKRVTVKTFTLSIDPLPAWAQGAFNGAASTDAHGGGSASMTVSALGAASGKFTLRGSNFVFSTKSFASRSADGTLTLATTASVGRVFWPLALTLNVPAHVTNATGTVLTTLSKAEGTLPANGWLALYRNIWKDAGMVTVLTNNFSGYYTAALPGGAEFGSGYLTLTLDKLGGVKTVGKLADGTALSLAGTLILDEAGRAFNVLYTPPAAYKGGGIFGLAELAKPAPESKPLVQPLDGEPLLWDNLSPTATPTYGAIFSRPLGLDGGWYDTVGNLYRYYNNAVLTAATDAATEPVPELLVGTNRYDAAWWDPDGIVLSAVTNKLGAMTGLSAPAAGAPIKVGTNVYSYAGATNAAGLTVGLTRVTGHFKTSHSRAVQNQPLFVCD